MTDKENKHSIRVSDGTFITFFDTTKFHVFVNDEKLVGLDGEVAIRIMDSESNYIDKLVKIGVPLGMRSDKILRRLVKKEGPIHLKIQDDNSGNVFESCSGYIRQSPNLVYGNGFPMGQFTVACVFMD